MAFLQTWTCDKCGYSQSKGWRVHGGERDMLELSVVLDHDVYARTKPKLASALWCEECLIERGLLARNERTNATRVVSGPSLEDLIADIVGQVLGERGVGS